jgi:hypothetical protein
MKYKRLVLHRSSIFKCSPFLHQIRLVHDLPLNDLDLSLYLLADPNMFTFVSGGFEVILIVYQSLRFGIWIRQSCIARFGQRFIEPGIAVRRDSCEN